MPEDPKASVIPRVEDLWVLGDSRKWRTPGAGETAEDEGLRGTFGAGSEKTEKPGLIWSKFLFRMLKRV